MAGRDFSNLRGEFIQLPPAPDGSPTYGFTNTQPANRFGDVGSQMGNEELAIAQYLLENAGGVTSQYLPDYLPQPLSNAVAYPADLGLSALMALFGGTQKAAGYGAEVLAGDTSSERRLANDIMAMTETGIPEMAAFAPVFNAGSKAAARGIMDVAGQRQGIGSAAASLNDGMAYRVLDQLSTPSGYSGPSGKPDTFTLPSGGRYEARPISNIEQAAVDYMNSRGMDASPITAYPQFSPERARMIAGAYDQMAHAPNDPIVRRAYDAMIQETLDQYNALKNSGIDFRFLRDGMSDPYAASPALGYQDLVENGRLWVFPTEFGFGSGAFDPRENPLLTRVGRIGDLENAMANDAFRAVHDAYGHFGSGNPFFRHAGEERAWQEHARMYSPEARPAMTSETRGQNSWLNFGPYGTANRTALGADTRFADQKTGLMPAWTYDVNGMPMGSELSGLLDYTAGWK